MLTDAELMLRKVALVLTVLLVIVGLWGGVRLFMLSAPEAVIPAPSSLQVVDMQTAAVIEDLPRHFVTRPVFWVDRTAYVAPPRDDGEPEPEPPGRSGELDKSKLLGMFGTGSSATAIVMHKGKAQRLKLNDSLDGWTFTYFSPDGAFFEKDMESRALTIEHAASVAPPKRKPKPVSRNTDTLDAPKVRDQRASSLLDRTPPRGSKKKGGSGGDQDENKKAKKKKKKSKSDKNKGEK